MIESAISVFLYIFVLMHTCVRRATLTLSLFFAVAARVCDTYGPKNTRATTFSLQIVYNMLCVFAATSKYVCEERKD